ncbi:hypothetical protein ACQ86G_18925 [Roseateles chitinivorans]|uniref:hypothetical protein n=1 Tax=Roseateles chitinivorans TaxID=2917965 RepID=UPI003D67556B
MISYQIDEFRVLCEQVRDAEDKDEDARAIEQSYEDLLIFLKKHESSRAELSERLCSIVNSYRHARNSGPSELSVDAIAYCMHELRWAEVKEAALIEQHDYFVARREDFLWRLIDAFDPDWQKAPSYARFSNLT